jgi:putative FmdB family regulatory protein
MPTYEFRCPNGHTFDQMHKISDAPQAAACPTCGADAVRAISGGAGLVFKGSGFYLTDYGKNAHRTSGPATAAGEGKGEAKSESKGEGAKAEGSKAESSKAEVKGDSAKSPSKDGGGSSSAGGGSGTTSGGSSSSSSTGGSSGGAPA